MFTEWSWQKRCFSLCPEGKVQPTFLRSLACAERAAGTVSPEWEDAKLRRFFHLILFISCSVISAPPPPPNVIGTARSSPPAPQPAAEPTTRKTAERVGNVSVLLPRTPPEPPRQRFSASGMVSVPCSCSSQDPLFESRNCEATMGTNLSGSPKQEVVIPQDYCFFLFFFCPFRGGPRGVAWPGL